MQSDFERAVDAAAISIDKISALRSAFHAAGADAAMISHDESVLWLTGYDAGCADVIVTDDDVLLLTDHRYIEHAQRQSSVRCETAAAGDRADAIEAALGGARTIAVQMQHMSAKTCFELSERLGVRFKQIDEQMAALLAVKTRGELRRMKDAADLTQAAFFHVLKYVKPGVAEIDLAAELTYFFMKHGAQNAFSPIIASGENGSMPHAVPSQRKIAPGDMVTFDIGAKLGGYCSDFTRTIGVFGLDTEAKTVYNLVCRVQCAALGMLKSGALCGDIHAWADGELKKEGFSLVHGLGHGVGVCIHESPRLSMDSGDRLQCSNVVTVEPGVYIAGRMGVRIEDMAVVTDGGAVSFYTAAKELIIV